MDTVEIVVAGAGVIGLAVARAYAREGREVLLLERHSSIGTEISSRNSEVIHSGIYYPRNSLKAEMCVLGKALLYEYCDAYSVAHKRCGKLILATNESQFDTLRLYQKRAEENGAGELCWMDAREIANREPEVFCLAGVFSESTGIIDTHAYMMSLLGDFEAHSGSIALNTALTGWRREGGSIRVDCGDFALKTRVLINACGLNTPAVANMYRNTRQLETHYAKGHYYTLSGKSPFNSLVYPVAESGGLGVHVTLDMAGQARFGPDVCWIDSEDYGFEELNRDAFVKAIQAYYPKLELDNLQPGYTGIRPKLAGQGIEKDFLIEGESQHGVPGLVNLAGIESPGLTASLAIAQHVVAMCS